LRTGAFVLHHGVMQGHGDRRDPPPSGGLARARGEGRGPRDARTVIAESFAVRSSALEALEAHRASMRRSRALLERARALCPAVDAGVPGAPRAELVHGDPGLHRCTISGCSQPSPFQPCFAVGYGDERVLVRDLPLRVCARHRADLDALFQRPAVLDALRQRLLGRGRGAPDAVRVLFEIVA
jgi:hypothetical protein